MKQQQHYITTVRPLSIPGEPSNVIAPTQFLGWDNNPDTAMSKALERGGVSGLLDSVMCDSCANDEVSHLDAMAECPRCSIYLDLINALWTMWERKVKHRKQAPELNRGANHKPRSCYEAMLGGAEVWYSDAPTMCGCSSGHGKTKRYVRTVESGACGICGASTPEDAEATVARRKADVAERKRKSRAKAGLEGAAR